jgi:hypothetical protein
VLWASGRAFGLGSGTGGPCIVITTTSVLFLIVRRAEPLALAPRIVEAWSCHLPVICPHPQTFSRAADLQQSLAFDHLSLLFPEGESLAVPKPNSLSPWGKLGV